MCSFSNGPVILGKIDIPVSVSKYSRCEECGHRSTKSVYIRHNGKQLCNSCDDWFNTLELDECDYFDGNAGYCE